MRFHGLESALTPRKWGFVKVSAEPAGPLKIGKLVIPELISNGSESKATLCFYDLLSLYLSSSGQREGEGQGYTGTFVPCDRDCDRS